MQGASPAPKTVSFETTLTATGNNTGIVVPAPLMEQLGAGKRPPVLVDINGYEYRSTVGVMRGQYMVSVSAAVRKATGLKGGDSIEVTLTVANTPREVLMPVDLERALAAQPKAQTFFAELPNSLQRYHADNINGAKTDETRQRRVDKAVALFLAGRQR
jgi:bifunctional DNA-binding transcriptional regulator/antitoxin component of YhaV-PrlF toxin-antitoxin module